MARFALLALSLVACGKVTSNSTDGSVTIDAPPDAAHLSKPVAKITSVGIAGAPAQCALATPSTGPGTINYIATWTANGVPIPAHPMTTVFTADTIAGADTHSNTVLQCTVFASNGTEQQIADPVTLTVKPRTAYVLDNFSNTLSALDLDQQTIALVGRIDVPIGPGDLAWDAVNQKLYLVDGGNGKSIYTIDVTTAHTTLVGVHGVLNVFGLGFDGSNKLFAGTNAAANSFSSVNVANGLFSTLGGNGPIDGLTFDAKRSLLMAVSAKSGQVSVVDPTTGVQQVVSTGTAGPLNDCGITYDPFIDKLWVVDASGRLFQYDPASPGYPRVEIRTFTSNQFVGIALALPPPA